MRATPQPTVLRPSRRALLLAGVTALATAGTTSCDLGPDADPDTDPHSGADPTAGAPSAASEDVDVELLDQARLMVSSTLGLVAGARRDHPRLGPGLAALHAMHRAHLALLDDVGPSGSQPGSQPGGPPQPTGQRPDEALARLRRVEAGHERELGRLAVRAASGSFARMLASMGAGVAAHLAALPAEVTR